MMMEIVPSVNGTGNAHDTHAGDKPLFTIMIDGDVRKFPPDDLANVEFADGLAQECEEAEKTAVRFTNLLDFDDANRIAVLDFTSSLSRCVPVVRGVEQADVFSAVLAAMVHDPDMELCRRAELAAVEVVALKYADTPEIACGRVQQRMK